MAPFGQGRRVTCCCRYGYQYDCINALRPEDDGTSACSLALESFRGCPCSDAVGRQKEYQEVMQRACLCSLLCYQRLS